MPRSAIVVLTFCMLSIFTQAQQSYWQQEVNYSMQVALNDKQHSLKANSTIEYINHSPDTLSFIWFHIWPNAYRNDQTALAKQLKDDKKNSKKKESGWIDSLNFTIEGKPVATEQHPEHIDIIKVILPPTVITRTTNYHQHPVLCKTSFIQFPFGT